MNILEAFEAAKQEKKLKPTNVENEIFIAKDSKGDVGIIFPGWPYAMPIIPIAFLDLEFEEVVDVAT